MTYAKPSSLYVLEYSRRFCRERLLQEIPEDVAQPGLPRAYYNSHSRVSALVSEAQRSIAQVTFTTAPSARAGQGEFEDEFSAQTSS